jgi:hypothetical protein
MVDELSLGLMPKVIDICYAAIAALKDQGLSILWWSNPPSAPWRWPMRSRCWRAARPCGKARRRGPDSTDMIDACLGLGGAED